MFSLKIAKVSFITVCFAAIALVSFCVDMVSMTSASRKETSASRYQSRSSMYTRGLIPRNWPRQVRLNSEYEKFNKCRNIERGPSYSTTGTVTKVTSVDSDYFGATHIDNALSSCISANVPICQFYSNFKRTNLKQWGP